MKQILLATLIGLSLVAVGGRAYAGDYVIQNTRVKEVTAYNEHGNGFWILTENTIATRIVCRALERGIMFFESTASSPEAHNQAFSTALAALLTGKPVDIYGYDTPVMDPNGQCVGHTISLKKQ
jgi:hypothetical protein